MILRLAREQLRAQRRFVVWTGVVLTVTMALASTALIGAATQLTVDHMNTDSFQPAGEHQAWVQWWTQGEPVEPGIDLSDVTFTGLLAADELEAMVDAAHAEGADATAQRWLGAWLEPEDGVADGFSDVAPLTRYPAPDWATIVIEGEAPETGQILLAADVAHARGISIGDTVSLAGMSPGSAVSSIEVQVSGFSAPTVEGPLASISPPAYALWEDGIAYSNARPAGTFTAASGEPTHLLDASVGWDGDPASLAALAVVAQEQAFGPYEPGSLGLDGGWTTAVLAGAGLTALATLGAAFSIGRSQAQSRIEWVAAARAIGARRSTMVAASAVEAVVVGAGATALGTAVGWIIVAGLLTFERNAYPGVVLPTMPSLSMLGAAALVAIGLVLAAMMAVFPAFWGSRVVPAAALKPVAPLTEQPLSRTVSSRWLVYATAGVALAVAAGVATGAFALVGVGNVLAICGWTALGVVVVADIVEAARRLTSAAYARVAHLQSPWAVALTTASRAKVRAGGAAAAVLALTTAGAVGMVGFGVLSAATTANGIGDGAASEAWDVVRDRALPSFELGLVLVGALTLGTVIGTAVVQMARRTAAAEDAVRGALGLTRADARRAAAAEVALPLASGTAVGSAAGWVVAAVLGAVQSMEADRSAAGLLAGIGSTGMTVAVVMLLAVPVIAAAAALASLSTRKETPVRELSRAGR